MSELLAPAGSYQTAVVAVKSGADAIYIGGKMFSARSSAKNFDNDEIADTVKYCHLHGVKVHVAANILVKENEVDSFIEYIGFLNDVGVDAVIIQDIGMASVIRKIYPDLPLHASTQMTVASLSAVKYLEKMGFSRVVLARELSFEEIKYICQNSNIEIEVFVHGAICMCYSGQCLMSSIIGARSGNRGMCAQPCRLPYALEKDNKKIKEGYLLSPKDMSLVSHIRELEKIGVASFKIEGRLKRAEYVATVVSVYRKYLDNDIVLSAADEKLLSDAFSRSGFTDGYYTNNVNKEMMSYTVPGNTAENTFSHDIEKLCSSDEDNRKIKINMECKMRKGERLYINAFCDGHFAEGYSDDLVEKAISRPISEERLKEQLLKLGGTSFEAVNLSVSLDDDAVISIKQINGARRRAISELEKSILSFPERRRLEYKKENEKRGKFPELLSVQVSTAEQLSASEELGADIIYMPIELMGKEKCDNISYVIILPEVCDEKTKTEIPKKYGVLVSNIGQLYHENDKYINYRANIFNSCSANFFKGCKSVGISPELNLKDISKIKADIPIEAIVYGKIPLMIMKNCPVRNLTGKCNKNGGYILSDRKNAKFNFYCDSACHSILTNSKNIYMADKIEDLRNSGINVFKIILREESYKESFETLKTYKDALMGVKAKALEENTFTRGHFYRGAN